MIGDIQNDDTELAAQPVYGNDKMTLWAGPSGTGAGRPTDYGWSASSANVPWNPAGFAGGVRYEDVTHTLEAGGSFSGRLMTMRWDNSSYSTATYFYPVVLEAFTGYELSFLYEFWSNATAAQTITAGISTTANAADRYSSQPFVTSLYAQRLRRAAFRFQSKEAGTYYLTFNGTWAMYGIGNFSLRSIEFENRLQVGKNYNNGQVHADVMEVNYDVGAWAPDILSSQPTVKETLGIRITATDNLLQLYQLPAGAVVRIVDIAGRVLVSQLANSQEMSFELDRKSVV